MSVALKAIPKRRFKKCLYCGKEFLPSCMGSHESNYCYEKSCQDKRLKENNRKLKEFMLSRIGKRIKKLRQKNNISQEDMASLLEIKPSDVSKIELCKRNPSDKQLESIAIIFSMELSELVNIEYIN